MSEFYKSGYYNCDCLPEMKKYPDNYFDLAIVDPPYGGGNNESWDNKARGRFGGRFAKYKQPDIACSRNGGNWNKNYENKCNHWDIAPPPEYFEELFRISKKQIIWGGNYFNLPPTRCFLIWRKLTISENFSMAMCEYAWTSFNDNAKWVDIAPQGTKREKRFHPTQKPLDLYYWILNNYAKRGNKILDTHCGSASCLVACEELVYDYVGFEIDKGYYDLGVERLEKHKRQIKIMF